ncbi:hypothetical protein [Colwellia hornerae]|uniref:Uncharacterized protein n=1 Tax=Colwellia hornerae TaxID=89402 RepID=A0A5C6QC20_9GAMM|nr:hypothetical protein [Colwellia hornerae]TWX58483.1 hypothetical protein ESZ28_01540 [Colwellia hornerae]TWX58719.1 hypothetical protein ESZ26_11355 [Colwellia hornerae]TWX66595.1 hypothetical protein ESZ27_10185 [Colwellia hornerae]
MFTLIVAGGDIMKFYLVVLMFLLQGCQQNSAAVAAKNSSEKVGINKIICQQSTTPPLKNTLKLKELLIANGKIDASLSDQEVEHAVNAYIRKKNAALKNCAK